MKLNPKQREQVRMMFGGKCAYCGHDLPDKGWHADHVEAVVRDPAREATFRWGYDEVDLRIVKIPVPAVPAKLLRPENDVLENMFPACRSCNIDKSSESLEDWRESIHRKINVLRDNHAAFRHAERFGLVTVNSQPVVFWFEKYEKLKAEVPAQSTASDLGTCILPRLTAEGESVHW